MMDAVQEEVASPSCSDENGGGTEDEASPANEDADETDSDTPKEEEENGAVCSSLKLDHRMQRTLFEFEDADEAEQAAADPQSLSQNLTKFKDDLCGWVPDTSVQYRRTAAGKQPPKAGRTGSKSDGASASSRRFLNYRNKYGHTHQHTANNVEYEFKHFGNYKKYSEQYRRFHTCGGPLQKLTQSALGGRSRTIYYAGDATAEAGVEVGTCTSNTRSNSQEPRIGQVMAGQTLRRPRVSEKPSSTTQPILSYSDISVNSPRYNLLSEPTHHRKARALQYPSSMEWTHPQTETGLGYGSQQRTGTNGRQTQGAQPQGQWNVAMNDQTLTVYTSKPPGSLPAPTRPATPPKPHLPFFPSQQPLRQLTKTRSSLTPPGLNPSNELLPSGYSLDRSLGTPAGYSTGISRNPAPHRDFYSQLMHAAHCLSLAAKSPKDFNFELPRWPTCTSHTEISTGTQLHQTSHPEKPPTTSSTSSSTSSSNANMQVQMMGRGVSTSPTPTNQTLRSTSRPCKQQHRQQQDRQKIRKSASMYSMENPTSATETHYITIEAPTCSPFDTRSAKQVRRPRDTTEEVGVSKAASYRVTLKEKSVVPEIKEKTSVEMVADANRPLAVCEVTWF
ncbi:uncharacterized protein LOC119734477 [Patiria miniata]|uniref:Uncharacterized protein n=1 Tax=Patiria miniata TaxID=46514 RepID=A0A914AK39_PATMI|nr:uncharacterized protein LOC119734477 [Patiria miniata]